MEISVLHLLRIVPSVATLSYIVFAIMLVNGDKSKQEQENENDN